MTRPESPLPLTVARSTSLCAAAFRAVGVARVFSFATVAPPRTLRPLRTPRTLRTLRTLLSTLLSTPLLDHAEHFPDFDVLPVFPIDPFEHATLRRRHFEVDLVGFELNQRIASGDALAFLAQPLRHAGVDDRLPDFRDDYVHRQWLPFRARQRTVLPGLFLDIHL